MASSLEKAEMMAFISIISFLRSSTKENEFPKKESIFSAHPFEEVSKGMNRQNISYLKGEARRKIFDWCKER